MRPRVFSSVITSHIIWIFLYYDHLSHIKIVKIWAKAASLIIKMNKCIVFIYCWKKKKNAECWSSQTESTTSFLYQLLTNSTDLQYLGKNRKARKKQQLKQKEKRVTLLVKLSLSQSGKRRQRTRSRQQKKMKRKMTEQRQKKMGKNHSMKLVFKHYTCYPMSRGTLWCG